MAYTETWNEGTPSGGSHRGYEVDDLIRELKRAIRERLEGDSNLRGLVTDFANACEPKAGMARLFHGDDADKGDAPLQDGRMYMSTDLYKLYLLLAAGIQEIPYLNLDGSRAMTGPLDMGGYDISNAKRPRARVTRTADQNISSGTITAVSWDSEDFDPDDMHDNSTNPSRITIPSDGAGLYMLGANIMFAADATGRRRVFFRKNGVVRTNHEYGEISLDHVDGPRIWAATASWIDVAAGNDYYEVFVYQDSGSTLALDDDSEFWLVRLW